MRHLLESRVVEEYACADSTGGRRPTKLRVAPAVGNAFVAELGQHHARLAIASREGELLATDDIKINIEIGPEKTIKALAKGGTSLVTRSLERWFQPVWRYPARWTVVVTSLGQRGCWVEWQRHRRHVDTGTRGAISYRE
ncbi:transcriptional regulator [Cutibacterium acnes JCM 18909]|nr:transcriptional regulator [Cutibacterium acnes JCM 18909]